MQVIFGLGVFAVEHRLPATIRSPRRRKVLVTSREGTFLGQDKPSAAAGFSLVEILAVLAITSILLSFSITAIEGLSRSYGVAQGANNLTALLERAQLYATANSTYTYLGMDTTTSPGDLEICSLFSPTGESANMSNLLPIGNLVRLSKITVAAKSALPGGAQSAFLSEGAGSGSSAVDVTVSQIPQIQMQVAGKSYPCAYVIKFGPDGSATAQTSGISRWIQIGLMPSLGSSSNPEVGLLQVTGLTGSVQVYRP